MSDNIHTPAAPRPEEKKAPAPAPAKPRSRRTGGSLSQRYEALVQPLLVPVDDLPEALGTIRAALEAAGEGALSQELFGKVVPAGILSDSELLDLNRIAESLSDLAQEVK